MRRVPLRIDTRLTAGELRTQRVRRARGRKPRIRRVIVVRPRVRFGRVVPITGRLTTPGGNPVANASLEVWQRISRPTARWRRVAIVGTNGNGRFVFKAMRGPSRVLRFRYPGTNLVRARIERGGHLGARRRDASSQPGTRGEWRRCALHGSRTRAASSAHREAGGAAGVLPGRVADLRHASSAFTYGTVVAHLPLHGHPRDSSLPLPRGDSARGRLSVCARDVAAGDGDGARPLMLFQFMVFRRKVCSKGRADSVRQHLTYANVMATVAVFIALGGTSYALTLPRNSVGPSQIRSNAVGASELRRGAVTSTEIKDRALRVRDLTRSARRSLRGARGRSDRLDLLGSPGSTTSPRSTVPAARVARATQRATSKRVSAA